jgi:uncharacterized membrane protein required for colicin V production
VTLLVDLIIVAVLAYAAWAGTKRGAIMLAFELGSFVAATGAALLAYHSLGGQLKGWLQVSAAMGNVAAFIIVWVVTEVLCALAVRFCCCAISAARFTCRASTGSAAALSMS